MKIFWKASLIRCLRTICQTAVAVIGTDFVISDVNWCVVISASLLAGILSILTSIATGLPEADDIDDDLEDDEEIEEEEEDEY